MGVSRDLMKIVNTFPGIYHFQAKNQYELTSTFIRLQEFYESPYKQIRGKYFELDDFFDIYAKKFGDMTYFTDWHGFNVPGHVVNEFIENFEYNFRKKEELFANTFCDGNAFREKDKYYVIGTWKDDAIDHELCHAWYYLDPEFKKHANACVKVLKEKYRQQYDKVVNWLFKEGYSKKVINDEVMAYMATSPPEYMDERFGGKGYQCGNESVYNYSGSFRMAFGIKKDEQTKIRYKTRVVRATS